MGSPMAVHLQEAGHDVSGCNKRRDTQAPRSARRIRRGAPVPTLMGWGTIPDDHDLNAGMVGLQTSRRYGNATLLASDFVLGVGNRWAHRHTGGLRRRSRQTSRERRARVTSYYVPRGGLPGQTELATDRTRF